MSHTTDISKRIKETKQEAEELKTQLQTLIDEGKKKICPLYSKPNLTSNQLEHEKTLKSPNKVQIIKSYENKHSRIYSADIPENKTETNIESLEKTKKYDVHEAREFMKRQKEKQKIEQKQTLKEEKIRAELQKKKLEELNRKSRILVAKNIQAQRERSISREREVYVRPDDSSNLRKAKSADPLNNATQNKTLNIIHPLELKNTGAKKKCVTLNKNPAVTDNKKISIISRNCTGETNTRSTHFKESTVAISKDSCADVQNTDKNFSPKNNENTENQLVNNLQSELLKPALNFQDHTSPKSHLNNNSTSGILRPISLFESKESKSSLPNSSRICMEPVTNVLDYKPGSIKSVTSIKSSKDVNEDTEKRQKAISAVTHKSNEALQPVVQCSVEIQTENSNKGFPQWLQEQPPQAYPFNFINTVKRKLQTATSQKPTTDIGIQSSIPPTESSKRKNKSEIKSFSSQKCPNLNTESIEQLELVPKSKYKFDNNVNLRKIQSNIPVIKVTETESESDTSKNIPEISSESGTSLKKNAESVRKNLVFNTNLIDTEKIDNMKLITHDLGSTNTIKKTELKPPSSSRSKNIDNKYSSDFDSDLDRSSESLDRSRESILSFNKSNYDRIIVSPQHYDKSEIIASPNNNRKETNPDIILKSGSKPSHTESTKSTESVNTWLTNSNEIDITSKNGSSSKSRSSKSVKSVPTQSVVTSLSNKEISLQNINTTRGSGGKSRLETSISPSHSTESVITSLLKNDNGFQNVNTSRDCSSSVKSNKILSEDRSNHAPSNSSTRVSDNIVTSSKNSVDHTDIRPSTSSINITIPKSDTSLKNINLQRGYGLSKEEKINSIKLVEPAVSLVSVNKAVESEPESEGSNKMFKNISIKSNKISTKHYSNDRNHIHLKFEAEIHLLNDFNKSIQKFSALEEAVENLKTKNSLTTSKILQNNDAQTSLKSSKGKSEKIESQNSRINYSRGSFTNNSIDDLDLLSNANLDLDNNSVVSTGLELSNLNSTNKSVSVKGDDPLMNLENFQPANVAGISLNMFEQLIKDEDARLEHLKTILKIREQALLDRTKGELAWLEIQRKHLKETGKLQEASVIKKKQRGILVNHQKEKHEMQRLKQMQKAQSLERKIVLKEQRNLIRQQLSTDNMLTKMKVNTPRERRLSGPLKVLQSNTESIRSETSISCRSSSDKEKDIYTITSHQSVISEVSEIEFSSKDRPSLKHQDYIKKTLLMRESALKKRRDAAEGLLQWHKKLLEEEKRIAILESTASAIISQKPNTPSTFKGKELNQLWYNLTGTETKKFVNDKNYPMSQIALERFCKSAREFSQKSKTLLKKSSDKDDKTSASEKIPTDNDYGSDFDNESIVLDQSIDLLINNFNKIQDNISTLNINKSKSDTSSIDEEILHKSESEAEISVIETNRIDRSISSKKNMKQTINESIHTISSKPNDQKDSSSSKKSSIITTDKKSTRKTTSKSSSDTQISDINLPEDYQNRNLSQNSISSKSSSISEVKSKSIEESQKLSDNLIVTSDPLKSDPMVLTENLTSTVDSQRLKLSKTENSLEKEFEDTNDKNISKDSVIITNSLKSGSKKSSNHSIKSYDVPEVCISQKSEESVDTSSHKSSSIKFGIKNDHLSDHQEISEEKLLTDEDLSKEYVDRRSHKSSVSSIRSEEKLFTDKELSQKSVDRSSHKSSASSIKSDFRIDNHSSDHQEVSEEKLLTGKDLSQKSVDGISHKSSASSIKPDFRKDNHQEVSEEKLLTGEDLSQKSVDGISHKSSLSSIGPGEKILTDKELSQNSVDRSSHKSFTSSIKSDFRIGNHSSDHQDVSEEKLLTGEDLSIKSVDGISHKSSASSIKSDFKKDNHQDVSEEKLLTGEDLSQKSVDGSSHKSFASSIKSDFRKDNHQEISDEKLLTDEDLLQKSVDRSSHKSSASSLKSDFRKDNHQEVSEEKLLTDEDLSQKSVDGSSHKSSASSIKSDLIKDNYSSDHHEVLEINLLTNEELSQKSEYTNSKGSDRVLSTHSNKSSVSSKKSSSKNDTSSNHTSILTETYEHLKSQQSEDSGEPHQHTQLFKGMETSQKTEDCGDKKLSANSHKSVSSNEHLEEKLSTDLEIPQKSEDDANTKLSTSIQIELSHKSEDSIRSKFTHSNKSSTSIPKSNIISEISLSGKPDYQKSTDILSKIHTVVLGEIKDVSGEKIHSVSHKLTPISQIKTKSDQKHSNSSKIEQSEKNGRTKEDTDTIDEAISSISSDSSLSNEEIYPRITKATKETLNESQEILQILGETEIKAISDEERIENQIKDNLTASEEILSKLIQPIENHDEILSNEYQIAPNETDDLLSQSLLKLYQISKSDKEEIIDIGVPLVDSTLCINDDEEKLVPELIESKVDDTIDENEEEEIYKTTSAFKIDQNNENQTFLNNLVASSTEIDVQLDTNEDSDESKLALSEKSNESFVVNDINEEIEERVKSDDYTSVVEETEEESECSHFSYGVLERSEDKETSESLVTDIPQIKEDATYEEKEHDSLSSATGGSSSEALNLEEQSLIASEVSSKSKNSIEDNIDVKKRVSEILADKNLSRGDKSPRLQDLYVTTYDLISPANSPEKGSSSPVEEHKLVSSIFDSEAEEILRKQLAVEEEIKAITEQQQKEQQLPLLYIREIPNKPPPPYTPPSSLSTITVPTIIPSSDEIEEITMYSAKILHKAYLSNNLANVNISNNTLSLISKNISKDCYKFVFDLCKDIAREHYKQFEEDKSPSWLRVLKKPELTLIKPLDTEGLKVHMIKKLKEIFGYQKVNKRENAIIKWSRKKRDHVDEILVLDCQKEEAQWINYEKDELLVKDQITDEIFESLLKDTADIFSKLL